MFGTNPVRKFEAHLNGALQVHEIFYTLQGEGPHSGLPAVFVRLSGCNLRCWWCDTKWDDVRDPLWQVEEIFLRVQQEAAGRTRLMVLTGGEPCRQDLRAFIKRIEGYNFTHGPKHEWKIQIETAGSLWQECLLSPWVEIICSPKTGNIDPRIKEHAIGFKYVINAAHDQMDADGLPLANTQIKDGRTRALAKPRKGAPVYLSPCDLHDDGAGTAKNYQKVGEIALEHGYRAGVQLHKLLELP